MLTLKAQFNYYNSCILNGITAETSSSRIYHFSEKRQFKFHVEVNKQRQLVIHALVHLGF